MIGHAAFIALARALCRIVLRHPPGHLHRITAWFPAPVHYDAHILRLLNTLKSRRGTLLDAPRQTRLLVAGARESDGSCVRLCGPEPLDSQIPDRRLGDDSVPIEPGTIFFEDPPRPCPLFRLGHGSIAGSDTEEGLRLIERKCLELTAGHCQI